MSSDATIAFASGVTFVDAMLPAIALAAAVTAVVPWLNRDNTAVRTCAVSLCIFVMWRYILWRLGYTIPPIANPIEFIVGIVFVGVEFLAIVGSTISLIFMSSIRNRSADADAAVVGLAAKTQLPLVDVFICTYNEEEAILTRVIEGAKDVAYANKRVWVLDDGRRDWLKALAEKMDCGYITRNGNTHAKAGNINNALAYIATLDEQPEYMSILDADFVCMPDFLTRTVALMKNEGVGVVQTPQHFSNADPVQENLATSRVWPDEQRFFFDVVMASKDAWGGAFCCGTSSLLRYESLCRIGGFPTDSVTEDYLLSLRLREIGYDTIYLNERLSVGLAPEGLKEYVTQRSRWCLGFVQICRGPSGPLRLGTGARLVDRIVLSETFLYWSATHAFRLLGIVVPLLYLLFGIKSVHADITNTISHVLPFFLTQILVMGWLTRWRVMPIMADLTQLLSAHEVARAVIVGLLKPQDQKFKVTAKGGDRSKKFIQWPMMRIFLGYLALTIAGILWAFVLNPNPRLTDASSMAFLWCWYNIVVLSLACYVCVEEPRKDARVDADEFLFLSMGAHTFRRRAVDVSNGGIRFQGAIPFNVGRKVDVLIDDQKLEATVVWQSAGHFGIKFAQRSDMAKARLARHRVGPAGSRAEEINPVQVATAVLRRAFR